MTTGTPTYNRALIRKLLRTVAAVFTIRSLLTLGDPPVLCGGATPRVLSVTLVFDLLILVAGPLYLVLYEQAAAPRTRLLYLLTPLGVFAIYQVLKNPCLLP